MSRPRLPEESIQVPMWVITFSDMTTNLLTFFVLLLSLGQVRDKTLFDEGDRVGFYFLQSVKEGFGFRDVSVAEHPSIKYRVDEPELPQGVNRDAREQRTRRLFATLRRAMETKPSQLKSDRMDFSVANVRYASGEAALDEAGRQWLSRFCMDLRQSLDPATTMLYVVGVAGGSPTEAQSWLLAARRSRVVADFMRQALSTSATARSAGAAEDSNPAWRILWWGAGPEGDRAGQDQPRTGQPQILIAILKTQD